MQGGDIDAGTSLAGREVVCSFIAAKNTIPPGKSTSEPSRRSYLSCAIAVGKRVG